MKLNPYLALHFDGRCEDAFKFYERFLGGKIAFMMRWSDSPIADQAAPEWKQKILHARIAFGDTEVVGGDVLPDQYEKPKGFSVMLDFNAPADAERVFQALAENGTVQIPLQKTFWATRFGHVVDQFNVPWTINCEETK